VEVIQCGLVSPGGSREGNEQGKACLRMKEWVKPCKLLKQDMPLEPLPKGGREPGSLPEAKQSEARDRAQGPRAPPATHQKKKKKKIKLIKAKMKHYV
jgi:hypothetical protein